MLASNFNHVQNHFLLQELEKLENQEFVSKEQLSEIKKNTVATKTNSNILVRFAFFLLGNFAISSVLGFVGLFLTLMEEQNAFSAFFLFGGILSIVTAEFISKKNFFSYGFDDSIILSIVFFLSISIGILTENVNAILAVFVASASMCAIRYVNVPSSFFSLFGLVGWIGYSLIEENILPSYYLPVVLFFIAIALFFMQSTFSKRLNFFIYKNVLQFVKIFSLVVGYVALNYFTVRELSEILMNLIVLPNQDIPLAPLFYVATFALPVLYIFIGLKQKDRTFFWIGTLTLGLGFSSIRYYYYFLPIELALMLGGVILFAIVYFAIQKLQNKTSGITFKEDKSINPMAFDVVKAILINANVNNSITSTEQSPMKFGGGEFSGGGSGGSF